MSDKQNASARLTGLDWIRGAASLWVLVYHVDITLQKAKYFGHPPLSLLSSVGYRGVELFFLLSGFVMARAYSARTAGSLTQATAFVIRRLLRIFPVYIVVFLPLFAIAAWKGLGAPPDIPMGMDLFFQNLLLLPRDNLTSFTPVSAWTLTHELMFYMLFMVSFISWRGFLVLLAFWGCGSLVLFATGVHIQGWAMQTSMLNAYFLIGLSCALVRWTIPTGWRGGYFALTVASLTLAVGLEGQHFEVVSIGFYMTQFAYAVAFVLVVFGLSRPGVSMPGILESIAGYLGRISYGIYLVNYPVVVVIALLAKKSGLQNNVTLLVVGSAVALSILIADLLYRFVERPAVTYGKTLFRKKS